MKIKFEVELDTDKVEDEERLEEILLLLAEIKKLLED
jgi:hypothetical protein